MSENNYIIHVTKEQLAQMPTVSYSGRITVVETLPLAIKAIAYLRDQDVVGFDTETRPSFRKGHVNSVALIQIATKDQCFLFRINRLGIFSELKDFLEDKNVKKIGL
ncbi:MAG: 3'-5' exonuclease domain-containing protein 2, partial [Muribaculaceae bacterium]|nr:3'-5' exonuclease domain-containing protein 2 [Muribaculaceae bacterium]